MSPFGGGHIAGFVPARPFIPVQEFAQVCSCLFPGAPVQEREGKGGIRPRAADDSVKQRCVPAEAILVNDGWSVHIRAVREQPLEYFAFAKIDRQM